MASFLLPLPRPEGPCALWEGAGPDFQHWAGAGGFGLAGKASLGRRAACAVEGQGWQLLPHLGQEVLGGRLAPWPW